MAKINLTGMFFFPKIVLSLHAHLERRDGRVVDRGGLENR